MASTTPAGSGILKAPVRVQHLEFMVQSLGFRQEISGFSLVKTGRWLLKRVKGSWVSGLRCSQHPRSSTLVITSIA